MIQFNSPAERDQYNSYVSQIQSGLGNYGLSDPFATMTPTISPTGSVSDWMNSLGKQVQEGIAMTPAIPFLPPGFGPTIGQTQQAVKTVYDVGVFLTDLPRLMITILGFGLIIVGFMTAANMATPITVVMGKK